MAKIGEKGFTVGTIYKNRHNKRLVVITRQEITDTGMTIWTAEAWDSMVGRTGKENWFTPTDRMHWMIGSATKILEEE